jgi:hypothetical protein
MKEDSSECLRRKKNKQEQRYLRAHEQTRALTMQNKECDFKLQFK